MFIFGELALAVEGEEIWLYKPDINSTRIRGYPWKTGEISKGVIREKKRVLWVPVRKHRITFQLCLMGEKKRCGSWKKRKGTELENIDDGGPPSLCSSVVKASLKGCLLSIYLSYISLKGVVLIVVLLTLLHMQCCIIVCMFFPQQKLMSLYG